MMAGGTIVLLNGTSCAGKTSIGHAVQHLAESPWLLLGADILGTICPPRSVSGIAWSPVAPGERALVLGPWGRGLLSAWHRAIGTLARAGQDVVVDHILQAPDWLADCRAAWADLAVLFVGVRCPLAVAEAREATRPHLNRGYARWSYPRVHAHGAYDLEVDTSAADPETCARRILDRLGSGAPFTAFRPGAPVPPWSSSDPTR